MAALLFGPLLFSRERSSLSAAKRDLLILEQEYTTVEARSTHNFLKLASSGFLRTTKVDIAGLPAANRSRLVTARASAGG